MADETAVTDTQTSATTTATTDATGATASGGSDATVATGEDGGGDGDGPSLMGAAGQDADDGARSEGEGEVGKDGAADTDGGKDSGVPETYTIELPEGVTLDQGLLDEATPVFKELGLTNDAANKLTPFVGKVQEHLLKGQADQHSAMVADWAKEAKADPEMGGRNWATTEANVARALDRFVGPATTKDEAGNEVRNEFRQLLDDTGLGNHPVMIRAFAKVGAGLGEDNDFVAAGATAVSKLAREQVLYPNDPPKT